MKTKQLKTAYASQKCAARRRGIEFNLTFNEWHQWWVGTGNLHLRGKNKGCFQMCRVGDVGPYAIGNIYCDSVENNSKLPHEGKPRPAWVTAKAMDTRRNNGKPWSPPEVGSPRKEAAKIKVYELIAWAIENKSTLTIAVRMFGCSWNAMRTHRKTWEAENGVIPLPRKASGEKNGRRKWAAARKEATV